MDLWRSSGFFSIIIDDQLGKVIEFHDVMHGFRSRRGPVMISLEAKLLKQLVAMRGEVLYKILLDLHKAYDYIYQEIYL